MAFVSNPYCDCPCPPMYPFCGPLTNCYEVCNETDSITHKKGSKSNQHGVLTLSNYASSKKENLSEKESNEPEQNGLQETCEDLVHESIDNEMIRTNNYGSKMNSTNEPSKANEELENKSRKNSEKSKNKENYKSKNTKQSTKSPASEGPWSASKYYGVTRPTNYSEKNGPQESSVPTIKRYTTDSPKTRSPCKKVFKCICCEDIGDDENDFSKSCIDPRSGNKSISSKNKRTKSPAQDPMSGVTRQTNYRKTTVPQESSAPIIKSYTTNRSKTRWPDKKVIKCICCENGEDDENDFSDSRSGKISSKDKSPKSPVQDSMSGVTKQMNYGEKTVTKESSFPTAKRYTADSSKTRSSGKKVIKCICCENGEDDEIDFSESCINALLNSTNEPSSNVNEELEKRSTKNCEKTKNPKKTSNNTKTSAFQDSWSGSKQCRGTRQTSYCETTVSQKSSVPIVKCFTVDCPEFKLPCKKVIECVCCKDKKEDCSKSCVNAKSGKKSKSKKKCSKNKSAKCPPKKCSEPDPMSGVCGNTWPEECPGDDSNFYMVPSSTVCPSKPLNMDKTLDFSLKDSEKLQTLEKNLKKCVEPDFNCKMNLYRIWKKYAQKCVDRYATTFYEPKEEEEQEQEEEKNPIVEENFNFEYDNEERKKMEPIQLDILRKMRELQELQEDIIKISRKPFGFDMVPIVTNMRLPFMKEDARLYVVVHGMNRNEQMTRQHEREKHTKELEERFEDLYHKVKALEKHLQEVENSTKINEEELEENIGEEEKVEQKRPMCCAPPAMSFKKPSLNYAPPAHSCFKLCGKGKSKKPTCSKGSPKTHQVFYSIVNPIYQKSTSLKTSPFDIMKDMKSQFSNLSTLQGSKSLRGFISSTTNSSQKFKKCLVHTSKHSVPVSFKEPLTNKVSFDSDFHLIKPKNQMPSKQINLRSPLSNSTN